MITTFSFTNLPQQKHGTYPIAHWASPLTVAWTEPFVQIYTKFAKIFNHILKIYALN